MSQNDTSAMVGYQKILDQMASAADTFSDVADNLEEQSELYAEHDNSETAHPYIQNLIKSINTVTPVDVAATVNTHNLASNTHEDIRAELRSVVNGVTTSTQIVENSIGEHNESQSAHPDIRATLATHSESLVTVRNNQEYIDNLDYLYEILGGLPGDDAGDGGDVDPGLPGTEIPTSGLGGSVDDLSKTVAVLTNTVGVHGVNISTLSEDTDFIQNVQIQELNSTDTIISKRVSDLELIVAQLAANPGSGSMGGVDLTGFECTMPGVVSADTDHTVRFQGLTLPSEDEIVSIEINAGTSGFTFSKTSGIGLDEDIQVSVPADVPIGIIKSFSAVVSLQNAAASSLITFPIKINSPPNVSALKHSIPTNVEPGKTYDFSISGAKDIDGQVVTYTIDITDSTLTFSKSEGIKEGEIVQATVPSDAVRGHTFTFDIIAVDELGASTSKMVEGGSVNIVPDVSGLQHTIPAVIKPGTTYHVTFGGATALDGAAMTYGVRTVEENSPLAFSEQDGILAGARVLLNADTTDSQRGQTFTVEITATDIYGASSTSTTTVKINQLPTADNVTINLPSQITGGVTLSDVNISGGVDVDGGELTYTIVPRSSILGFSKTKNIKQGENITVTVPLMMSAMPMTFDIEVTDSVGEKAETPAAITVVVTPKLATVTPTVLYPENSQFNVPFDGFTIRVSDYETEVDN